MTNEEIALKISEHDLRLNTTEEKVSNLEETTKRIESLTLSVQKLAFSVQKMAEEQIDYRKKQNELSDQLLAYTRKTDSSLEELKNAPVKAKAKKYDKYASEIASLILGALVSFLLMYFLGI